MEIYTARRNGKLPLIVFIFSSKGVF